MLVVAAGSQRMFQVKYDPTLEVYMVAIQSGNASNKNKSNVNNDKRKIGNKKGRNNNWT